MKDKEILSSLLEGWIESGAELPGDLCYNDVIEFLHKNGLSSYPVDDMLEEMDDWEAGCDF